jgi:hypothetical protein
VSKQKTNAKATGKHKGKILAYYQFKEPAKKIRRILKRNGLAAAKAWAGMKGAISLFEKICREKGIA